MDAQMRWRSATKVSDRLTKGVVPIKSRITNNSSVLLALYAKSGALRPHSTSA